MIAQIKLIDDRLYELECDIFQGRVDTDDIRKEVRTIRIKVAALEQMVKDSERLDFLESIMRSYGDGYTEPRESHLDFNWQQANPKEYFPGLRKAIDAMRTKGKQHEKV